MIIFNYFLNMYKLSRVLKDHKRDVRCIDYFQGKLVSGGSDKVFNFYNYQNGHCTLISTSDIFDSQIIAIKINRIENSQILVVLGCRNGKIYGFDREGNPAFELTHDSTISSIAFIDGSHFVTGSWDGKAIVWSIPGLKKISEFNQHKHAVTVFYNSTNGHIISGSQDKSLNLWDWRTGNKIKRIQNAHGDIIRQISDIQGSGMIITCSNDQKLKIWSADLELIDSLVGHTAFVFTVKAISLGNYISGGEDKTVKVWSQNHCVQDIQQPASVWSLAFDQNNDIFVAGSDGTVRTFTTNPDRRADENVQEIFNKQILESSSKKSGMSEQQIKKLMTSHQMKAVKGKKQGQIRVFRNGMVPEAYMWQNSDWVKIGDVITESGAAGGAAKTEPRYYPGDKYFEAGNYDYVFDVDDESGVPKVIPFNDGGNPLQAAEKYCKRQGHSKAYVEQIRKFLIQNSSKVPRSSQQMKEQKEITTGLLKCTPSTSNIEYNDIKNPAALFNKIKEFNQNAEGKKLTQKELAYIQRIATALQNSSTYHTWKLDFKEMDAIKKLITWPKQLKFPVWDLLRAFLKHYQSESLFSGLDAGGDIITALAIGLETEYSEAIYTLIFKTLSNVMIQNTNKNGIIKNFDIIFIALKAISKRKELKSANYLTAFAVFLFNVSITFLQKNIEKEQLFQNFAQILRIRLELDQDQGNRGLLLQAGANILSKYHSKLAVSYNFLLKFLQGDDVSSDIKLFY